MTLLYNCDRCDTSLNYCEEMGDKYKDSDDLMIHARTANAN